MTLSTHSLIIFPSLQKIKKKIQESQKRAATTRTRTTTKDKTTNLYTIGKETTATSEQ